MPSRSSPVYDMESISGQDIESGYVSGSGSEASLPELYFTKPHLQFLNRQLQNLEPQGKVILRPCQEPLLMVWDNRNSTMVHHNSTLTLSDHCFRPHWAGHRGHALKDENPEASNG